MHLQSILTHLAWLATTLVVVFMHCAQVEAYLTSTAFVTSVTTVTVTSTSQVSIDYFKRPTIPVNFVLKISQNLCGKLVNVTGACRRRRNFEFERPEIQIFGGHFDEAIELAYRNAYFRKQFVPTKTLR